MCLLAKSELLPNIAPKARGAGVGVLGLSGTWYAHFPRGSGDGAFASRIIFVGQSFECNLLK